MAAIESTGWRQQRAAAFRPCAATNHAVPFRSLVQKLTQNLARNLAGIEAQDLTEIRHGRASVLAQNTGDPDSSLRAVSPAATGGRTACGATTRPPACRMPARRHCARRCGLFAGRKPSNASARLGAGPRHGSAMIERKRRARTCLKMGDGAMSQAVPRSATNNNTKQWIDAAAFVRTPRDNASTHAASSTRRSVKLPVQGDQS